MKCILHCILQSYNTQAEDVVNDQACLSVFHLFHSMSFLRIYLSNYFLLNGQLNKFHNLCRFEIKTKILWWSGKGLAFPP